MDPLTVATVKHWILAMSTILPRLVAMFTVIPFLGKILHGQLRNSFIVSICLILLPVVLPAVPKSMESILLFLGIMAKEVVVGLLMGFLVSIPFWAIEGVGFIMDNQRGATMVSVFDPMSGEQTSLYGSLFLQLTTVLLFTTGGFLSLLAVIFKSYEIWPVGSFFPSPQSGFAIFFLDQMDRLMELMVLYAAPIVIAVFLAEFGLGLINRFSPQLNVFSIGFPITLTLGFVFMLVSLPVFLPQFSHLLDNAFRTLGGMFGA